MRIQILPLPQVAAGGAVSAPFVVVLDECSEDDLIGLSLPEEGVRGVVAAVQSIGAAGVLAFAQHVEVV